MNEAVRINTAEVPSSPERADALMIDLVYGIIDPRMRVEG